MDRRLLGMKWGVLELLTGDEVLGTEEDLTPEEERVPVIVSFTAEELRKPRSFIRHGLQVVMTCLTRLWSEQVVSHHGSTKEEVEELCNNWNTTTDPRCGVRTLEAINKLAHRWGVDQGYVKWEPSDPNSGHPPHVPRLTFDTSVSPGRLQVYARDVCGDPVEYPKKGGSWTPGTDGADGSSAQ